VTGGRDPVAGMPPDTAPVRPDEGFDVAALDAYVRPRLPRAEGPLEIAQFPAGHSNLTYLLRYGGDEYVMRRPPLGPLVPKAHDMTREHCVLDALWPVFPPAPRPFLLCEDAGVIGAPFYEVFARYKTAVVVQQIYIRWKRGQTRDERFGLMAPRVEALARAALDLAERSGC